VRVVDRVEQQRGLTSAHLRAGDTHALISVRALQPLWAAGATADQDPDTTVEIARYAVELAHALARSGENPRQIDVQAIVRPAAAASSAQLVDLYVVGDVPGIDDTKLDNIAKEVLVERRSSGAWQLDGEARVRATKLFDNIPNPEDSLNASADEASSPASSVELTASPPIEFEAGGRRRFLVRGAALLALRSAVAFAITTTTLITAAHISEGVVPEPSARLRQFELAHSRPAPGPAEQRLAVAAPASAEVGLQANAAALITDEASSAAAVVPPTAAPFSPPTIVPSAATPVTPVAALPKVDFSAGRPASPAWPNNPNSTAWLAPDGYHLFARQADSFVAVGVGSDQLRDAVVAATFHKTGGPPGGGYGLIVRDQEPASRDGLNQAGRFYVFEVGDRGEVGIWRRAEDHWVDLVPWSPSAAVQPGAAENQLRVTAAGDQLAFLVNGVEVAATSDAMLTFGGVGVFVGGDLNQAVLTRLTVQGVPAN